jgi:hypothetical protein
VVLELAREADGKLASFGVVADLGLLVEKTTVFALEAQSNLEILGICSEIRYDSCLKRASRGY